MVTLNTGVRGTYTARMAQKAAFQWGAPEAYGSGKATYSQTCVAHTQFAIKSLTHVIKAAERDIKRFLVEMVEIC